MRLFFLFVLLIFPFGPALAAEELPNFVLLMGDDHGWEETGYNGHPHVKTPVLDEMAATGLRFERFYAAPSQLARRPGRVFLPVAIPIAWARSLRAGRCGPRRSRIAHILKQGRLSLRALRQMACRPGQSGFAHQPRSHGLSTNGFRTTTSSS